MLRDVREEWLTGEVGRESERDSNVASTHQRRWLDANEGQEADNDVDTLCHILKETGQFDIVML